LLQKVVERRLSKDWDQIQVETAMEAIGLSCGVWNRKGERDLNITTATPQFTCIGNMTELVDAPSRPQVMFGRIQVSVRFAEAGETRSWQQIEVKTYEMRGRLDVLRELRRLP
jgi:hypothetical protein